jgi:hypothetical protein
VDGFDGSAFEGITRASGREFATAHDPDDVDGCAPCVCEALGCGLVVRGRPGTGAGCGCGLGFHPVG